MSKRIFTAAASLMVLFVVSVQSASGQLLPVDPPSPVDDTVQPTLDASASATPAPEAAAEAASEIAAEGADTSVTSDTEIATNVGVDPASLPENVSSPVPDSESAPIETEGDPDIATGEEGLTIEADQEVTLDLGPVDAEAGVDQAIELEVPVDEQPPVLAPVLDEIAPVLEEIEPVLDEIAPVLEEIAPVLEPVLDVLDPVLDEFAPLLEETELVLDVLDPVLDEIAPILAPVTDATAPALDPVQVPELPIDQGPAPFPPIGPELPGTIGPGPAPVDVPAPGSGTEADPTEPTHPTDPANPGPGSDDPVPATVDDPSATTRSRADRTPAHPARPGEIRAHGTAASPDAWAREPSAGQDVRLVLSAPEPEVADGWTVEKAAANLGLLLMGAGLACMGWAGLRHALKGRSIAGAI